MSMFVYIDGLQARVRIKRNCILLSIPNILTGYEPGFGALIIDPP